MLGFADTYALRESSAAPLIEAGESGGLPVVQKWLVSRLGCSSGTVELVKGTQRNEVGLIALPSYRASLTLKLVGGSVLSCRKLG